MFNPVSTYRIQFHKDFTFKNLEQIIPYLQKVGVATLYASPIFEATPGSNHGYDVVNPHRINPEIGTLGELRSISKKLKEAGINWLQDIVPNHMAFHPNNLWLMDVLEKGQQSTYAPSFDIIWKAPTFKGKLMVPFLGATLQNVIDSKQLSVIYQKGQFTLSYGDQAYPVNMLSYQTILQSPAVKQQVGIEKLISEMDIEKLKEKIANAYQEKEFKKLVDETLKAINKDALLLQKIANEQYYQLSLWSDSDHQINYRRFFTVNGLICLNIQDEQVFDHYHQFIKSLLDEGIIQGLRVDHVDGLYDPTTYLQRLRALAGEEIYIVVEKILEEGEAFPTNWPVQGNTGYDFLATVNNVFTSAKSKRQFTNFYQSLISTRKTITKAIPEKKAAILYKHMAGELDNLYNLFIELKLATDKQVDKVGPGELKTAIGEFLIRCPVYRYYGNHYPLGKKETKAIKDILNDIVKTKTGLKNAVDLLQKALLKNDDNQQALSFYQRCMQFTGPLMAKGVEDTLMYTYDRFVGHNEVGDSPAMFGLPIEEFHQQMIHRQKYWPLSINATSTHDTKRGEDVRARLNVLTDIAYEWFTTVKTWQKVNKHLKKQNAPDANDEYLIYQTLTGFYPLPGGDDSDVRERLQAYLTKALREAKTHTQWAQPNQDYEQRTLDFAAGLLDKTTAFWKSFIDLQMKVADNAVVNSLAQVLLKFTAPGVPDVYQGCELWDLSLVDPDNRRPVDYKLRSEYADSTNDIKTLWQNRYTGQIKQWLTEALWQLRKQHQSLFTRGDYIPLKVTGLHSRHVMAFARQHLNQWIIIAAPLHLASLKPENITAIDWGNTAILIPKGAPLQWDNSFGGKQLIISESILIKEIFLNIPIAVLTSAKTDNDRSAGIIMHITSLPSPFAVGDMGPEARKFVDFLNGANQKYWQLLPLNPTSEAAYHSPYSAFSSMAGNVLLISPEDLVRDGLLKAGELKNDALTGKVDYKVASKIKTKLLAKAFERQELYGFDKSITDFLEKEAYWLEDFALYEALKVHHKQPWYQWPDEYKYRDKKALKLFSEEHRIEIERSKWLQYIFSEQWNTLKAYGNEAGISFFGDLPFYVSHDSADVWAQPELFKLDKDKHMAGIAGVPPDYFNAAGQLWGMPVYDWQKLKNTNYKWWVNRIRRNLEFYDLIRLDHFRAFYDYWEVPAGEETAVNGTWKPGPGSDLFRTLQKELGELPFVAEDLGEINKGVYDLRDEFNLPGMNVLQFAFGADMPVSMHIPHNHAKHNVAYTATHDNNTALGWFKQDATKANINNLGNYANAKITAQNVNKVLMKLCYSSAAQIAMVPLQDVLGLDEHSRINTPASAAGNWLWRSKPGQLNNKVKRMLQEMTRFYNRE